MAKDSKVDSSKLTKATTDVVKLLTPFSSEERQKIIQASLMLLGENEPTSSFSGGAKAGAEGKGGDVGGFSPKAAAWVRQNSLNRDQLDHVFDIDGANVVLIADNIPGKSTKEKAIACYVLQGIVRLLATGEPTFDDKTARQVCEDHGCYDNANHAVYLKDLGNLVTGSKKTGWKVTTPGLKKGAEYIKDMTKEA